MSEALAEFKAIKAKLAEMKKDANARAKLVFEQASRELFLAHPELESIRWNQYTPYFNDGDACTFRSNHKEYFEINGEEIPWRSEERTEIQKAVGEFLKVFDDEDMLELWGDHSEVTVTREGVEVDEYEHD